MEERMMRLRRWAVFAVFAAATFAGWYWLAADGLSWSDFAGQWRICAYTLRGVDPYPEIAAAVARIPEIGVIPSGWSTSPYGCVLGNLYYGGFLPMESAQVYFLIINALLLAATALSVHMQTRALPAYARYGVLMATLLSLESLYSIDQGNAGGMICCLTILAILWRDKPLIGGLALGFAMVKPQVALLAALVMLLQKRGRLLLVAAALDILGWAATSLLTGTGLLTLLREFLMTGAGDGYQFAGVFTLAGRWLHAPEAGLILSMCAGIAFVMLLYRRGRGEALGIWAFVPCCMASTFWCYTFLNDNYVMLLPTLLCMIVLLTERLQARDWLFWMAAWGYCGFGRIIRSLINAVFEQILPTDPRSWFYGETIYEMGLIVIGVLICRAVLSRARGRENTLLFLVEPSEEAFPAMQTEKAPR